MINQCRDFNIDVIIHHLSLGSHSQAENKVFNITSQNRSSGDSNLICGGEFGRISVYSQVKTKSKVQHHATSSKSSTTAQYQELYKFQDLVIKVVAPRTIGLNVQLTNAAGENVARCSFKTCRSYMNTNDAIDILQGRFELYQPFCLSSHNADCGR